MMTTFFIKTKIKRLWVLFAVIACQIYGVAEAQNSFTEYSGKVTDEASNKALVFANLNVKGTNISTITNTDGEFLLKVPHEHSDKSIIVSHLGYHTKEVSIATLSSRFNKISLEVFVMPLPEVNINAPKSAVLLVERMLKLKGDNYMDESMVMTAFYRETIRKRRKNASLSEAVLEIYKEPYKGLKKDVMKLLKSRKSTNYSRLDTVTLKLQGGPFSTLYSDLMKYPDFVFNEDFLSIYDFHFDRTTQIDERLTYVIRFSPKKNLSIPLYSGKLFIDAKSTALVSAIYSLNLENRRAASKMFIKRKPPKAFVYPTRADYRIDYRVSNNKWYYGYSNVQLAFKINWDDKFFNSLYSLGIEMAVTDWEKNPSNKVPRVRERLRSNVILVDKTSGFSDPEFWGDYNIIEPEKSIESAIKKIQKQLKKLRD